MQNELILRAATLADADKLLAWRNDPATRAASHNTSEVAPEEHAEWLRRTIANPARKLLVAEVDGKPVGTARADYLGGAWELSWAVAPGARGAGIGKRIVATLAARIADPIRAEIKADNASSVKMAQHAGMSLEKEENGILHFRRGWI